MHLKGIAKQMCALVAKFRVSVQSDGLVPAVRKTLTWGIRKVRRTKTRIDPFRARRIELSTDLDRLFNSTVKYGPLAGLKLSGDSWWGAAARGAMLLGLYEQEVLSSLTAIPKRYDTFVELGAGDGYYAIGVLIADLFKKSICYEASDEGRRIIRLNAERNGVSDRVDIHGAADRGFYAQLSPKNIESAVLFVDIEGAEFDLLDEAAFRAFGKSIIFLELHEWRYQDGDERLRRLKADAKATHSIRELTTTSRDLSKFAELRKLSDTDRWLICSEGRAQLMTWLRFDPLSDSCTNAMS
jgi:hypothetical protein